VSKVGLVLGGGGITGASYELAALMAIHMATGWDPNSSEVIIGTSAGSFVAATVRSGRLSIDSLARHDESQEDVTDRIRTAVYRRRRPGGVRRWIKHGLVPGIRKPGVSLILGSPAPFDAGGIGEWLTEEIGDFAEGWPDDPTVVVAYELESKRRVAFGTIDAPDVGLSDAVSASSAVPLVFAPFELDGKHYVDGGVASGTHADLLIANEEPLDFVLIVAPMAADEIREGGRFYEGMFDRVGRAALDEEVEMIRAAWPDAEVLSITPSVDVQALMRPNPMSATAAVPTFIKTLASLRMKLARPDVWNMLSRHLATSSRQAPRTVNR
jgi:NTE family protein